MKSRAGELLLFLASLLLASGAAFLVQAGGHRKVSSPQLQSKKPASSHSTHIHKPAQLRLGFFPNITHAQALIGTSRGDFQKAIGSDVKLETATFNAGPSVIEALYAKHLDLAYVGPSPTINGFLRSDGRALRVIAGSANNGILIVGSRKRGISHLEQLPGKRIATPQYANTQDISAKHFLTAELGAKLKDRGGDTDVIPMANPDIEILMEKGQIDAAWVPEPWGSRMEAKGLVVVLAEEKDLWPQKRFTLTSVVARTEFLEQNPDLVEQFLSAHVRITEELQANPQAFADLLNTQLKKLTGKSLPKEVVLNSLNRTEFSTDPAKESYAAFFHKAKELRLVKGEALDVDLLVNTAGLDRVRASKRVPLDAASSAILALNSLEVTR